MTKPKSEAPDAASVEPVVPEPAPTEVAAAAPAAPAPEAEPTPPPPPPRAPDRPRMVPGGRMR